jgi:Flp pilus assembly protein TadD
LSKTEALAQFHARQAAYLSLMDLLREERPSHVLIIGTRGMGKTTLLQRVCYGVEEDAGLNSRYLVLAFPEEQYNVNRLHHFLLNTVDALADAMERLQNKRVLAQVEAYADLVGKRTPEEIEEQVPRFLAEIGQQMQKDFLLLVDNADRLFEMIEDRQQWQLRELLSSRRDLTFFGATTQASDGIYGPQRAFFEFFRIHRLEPLTFAEVRDLLLKLSESVEEKEGEKGAAKRRVAEWLDADAARLRTLVQLTGGNPRTTVLLFHLVLDGLAGGAREYLEQLLDQVTPGYKGRVDELPAQAQQVLDAVALRWDPVTAMEMAQDTGLETSAVSAQLTRLLRQGILEKADPGDSRKALYQVAERFFNIWYLMRASRRVRAKLRWFVEFLRVFFDSGELEQMAWERIERHHSTWRGHPEEIETAFAYVLASGAKRDRLEQYLREKCTDSEEMWRPYLELPTDVLGTRTRMAVEDSSSFDPARPDGKALGAIKEAIRLQPDSLSAWAKIFDNLEGSSALKEDMVAAARKAFVPGPDRARFLGSLAGLLRQAVELEPGSAWLWGNLGVVLSVLPTSRDDAEAACRKAIELDSSSAQYWNYLGMVLQGMPGRTDESEAAYRKAIGLDSKFARSWNNLGNLLAKTPGRIADAEAAHHKAIELQPKSADFWNHLGDLLAKTRERAAEAEAAYRKALELDPTSDVFWNDLGYLLTKTPERAAEAEAAYRRAIELGPEVGTFWDNLGDLLAKTRERAAEAEAAYCKALELDPTSDVFWNDLGYLLTKTPERAAEAEAAYRKAIELDPKFAGYWNNLGIFLAKVPERTVDAEAAFRRAIELDEKAARFWDNLGDLLAKTPERVADAEVAYRKAIELDPTSDVFWNDLGRLLAKVPERTADAEAAYRKAIELDRTFAGYWNNLGKLVARLPERAADAETACRKAIELNPTVSGFWNDLGNLLAKVPERAADAESAYRNAIKLDPKDALAWAHLGFVLACWAGKPGDAEVAFRNSVQLGPTNSRVIQNLGVLLYCELNRPEEAAGYLRQAHEIAPRDPISAALFAVSLQGSEAAHEELPIPIDSGRGSGFWDELLGLCQNYPPFGKLLLGICDLVQEQDSSNRFARLYRAVALAQLGDFPRASVALEDALTGDPIDLLSIGQRALETFLAAAVKNGRVRDCLELIDKKEWKDAWRPIYEALKAVEAGSAEYLKRVAVEIRHPAQQILRHIAPQLPDLPGRTT